MSKSGNMLRTRRRDNNVKPNRRLDRKSSRGMIYENEELRLKTININAEIERGQSDIKKLKRENEMLKKEIWCLRDEYEKLDKMLKEKEIEFSSSSTTCSSEDSESCSSCSDASEEVETSQNLENVQKTTLKNFRDDLSVVPEENSAENSTRDSPQNCEGAIKPDQSYPVYTNLEGTPKHFFSPINISTIDHHHHHQNYLEQTLTPPLGFYENPIQGNLQPKTSTDLLVKTDNRNFQSMTPTQSSFSNGGNLEELLNDIETISQDILKISNAQSNPYNYQESNDIVSTIQNSDLSYVQNTKIDNYEVNGDKKPYKSELNVVLMPTPMPLIGFDKYRNLHKSLDSVDSRSLEELSASTQNLRIIPENLEGNFCPIVKPPDIRIPFGHLNQNAPVIPLDTIPPAENTNPFFFGNLQESFNSSDYFDRYNPENYTDSKNEKTTSKSNLLEIAPSDQNPSSENEENLKFGPSKSTTTDAQQKDTAAKSPKMSIRRKVSIHFKGKKDKKKQNTDEPTKGEKPKTPIVDKKLLDVKVTAAEQKSDKKLQKTPSLDSKKSDVNFLDAKTSSDSNKKYSSVSSSDTPNKAAANAELVKTERKTPDKKCLRKSSSISPDRKHVHLKDENKRCHRKHKRGDRRQHRSTLSTDRLHRERSYSVCTDRSNILDHRLGFSTNYLYDDYTSDRERTNSISSCDTIKTRKMSNISNIPVNGKIPWCGCWGNGCL